ncbi:hypothetical protein [Bacillus sp. JCM 19041]|uniref:hypothetical protein n=1 Tax=Bacillus sp. JCM 19041 TaxID=1460637 RepID=UPI0006D21A3C
MRALFLNGSLKRSNEESNTEVLMNQVANELTHQNVLSEQIRLADFNIHYGISDDLGDEDEWPLVIEKLGHLLLKRMEERKTRVYKRAG